MGDLLKEFNMIDLLGMMLPGSMIILLLGGEYEILDRIRSFLGDVPGGTAMGLIVVAAGYVVGMIIHEVGDLLEKLLWSDYCLHPRTYAALHTGYLKTYKKSDVEKPQESCRRKIVSLFALTIAAIGISFIFLGRVSPLIIALISLFSSCVLTAILRARLLSNAKKELAGSDLEEYVENTLAKASRDNRLLIFHHDNQKENADEIRASLRKRDLFNGFKAVSRNLLISIILMNLYAMTTRGKLFHMRQLVMNERTNLLLLAVVTLLLLIRYYHYSYLVYKYLFEDDLMLRASISTPTKNKSAHFSHRRRPQKSGCKPSSFWREGSS